VTEYDKILTVTSDGSYRITAPPDKLWMPGALLYAAVFDAKNGVGLTVIYRDANMVAWGKKVRIERFITNKVYSLVREGALGIEYLSDKKSPGSVLLHMVPKKRQKVKAVTVNLNSLAPCGLAARGAKLSAKPLQSVEQIPEKEKPVKPR
jgi:hypothetical protein